MLKCSKNHLPPDQEYTQAEQEILSALSLEESQRRTAKLAKMRALISYRSAENKRRRAIKSKKYHRVHKRGERRQLESELGQLIQNCASGPEAMRKLEQLEMDRIAERSRLKHSTGGSKWAKSIRRLAKKDPKIRESLQTQLRLGRELREKVFATKPPNSRTTENANESSSSDNEDTTPEPKSATKISLVPQIAQDVLDNQLDNDQNQMINEAFEDDDFLDTELDRDQNDDNDVTGDKSKLEHLNQERQMPGWNSWAGPGLMEKRKKQLKTRLALQDNTKSVKKPRNTILSDKKHLSLEAAKDLCVKQLPFPYAKRELFEENMNTPLGKEWNTQTSYRLLAEPAVKMRKGHVIRPISSELFVGGAGAGHGESASEIVEKRKERQTGKGKKALAKDAEGNVKF